MLHIKVHISLTQQSLIIGQQNGHHQIVPSYTFEKSHKDQNCITQCLSRKAALHKSSYNFTKMATSAIECRPFTSYQSSSVRMLSHTEQIIYP